MKYVIATVRVLVETQPELIAVLTHCKKATLREPACRGFDILVSATDPEKVVVVESFDSHEDHMAHIEMPYVRAVHEVAERLALEKTFENIYADRVEVDHG